MAILSKWLLGKVLAVVACAAMVVGVGTGARAALLAYEGFDYQDGTALSGLSGGSGWTSVWNNDWRGAPVAGELIQADSLTYTDSMGNVLDVTGGKLLDSGVSGTSVGPGRQIDRRATGTTWVSFLAQRMGPDTNGDGIFGRGANAVLVDLGNLSGVNIEKLDIGPENSNNQWTDPNDANNVHDYWQFRYPSMTGGVMEADMPNVATNRPTLNYGSSSGQASDAYTDTEIGQINLLVMRIDHIGDEMTADDVRMWLNPRLDEVPSDTAVSTSYIAADIEAAAATAGLDPWQAGNFGDLAFNYFSLFSGNDGGDGYAELLVDEIRVADSFADVVPFTPGSGGCTLSGDFDCSGGVENGDLTLLLNNWAGDATPVPAGWTGVPQPTDPAIDNDELTALLNGWGTTVGSGSGTNVPEPAACVLLAIGLCGVLAGRGCRA